MLKQRSVAVLSAAVLLLLFCGPGCETPPEVGMNQALVQGTVEVSVTGYSVAYLDLETTTGSVQTTEPVLLINMSVTNNGSNALQYDLGWSTGSSTQADTTLLFNHTAEKVVDSIVSGNIIRQLNLQQNRYLADPVSAPVSIPAGETIEDVLLFQLPPEGTSRLVLSVPPRVFGPEITLPGYITISYSTPPPEEIAAPPVVGVGQPHQGDVYSFQVTTTSFDRVRMIDSTSEGPGYTRDPLLRIDYTLTNTSDQVIAYTPPTITGTTDQPVLTSSAGISVPRAEISANYSIEGQITQPRQISPGQSVSDFVLFTSPGGSGNVRLSFPGQRLGGSGMVRVDIPFTETQPPTPQEILDAEQAIEAIENPPAPTPP